MALRRDEVGDHRAVGRVADRTHPRRERREDEPGEDMPPDDDEPEQHERLAAPAREDQRPAADVIGDMAAGVAGEPGDQRAGEEREPELGVARAELLLRPDPDEHPGGRACGRPDERDGEHGAQRPVGVVTPDEAKEAREQTHARTVSRLSVRKDEDDRRERADDADEEAHVPILRAADERPVQIVLGNR